MADKRKVLILGCGNIGALYDFKKEGVKTHVKAFTQDGRFETIVYDQNRALAGEVAEYYQIKSIEDLEQANKLKPDVVVIGTPTPTHFDYLNNYLEANTPVIICEKPVTDAVDKLQQLEVKKKASDSKVLVNYFRRFHPCYAQLKEMIAHMEEPLTNIQVTYQRGFSNNASHALDLLYFLFGEQSISNLHICNYAFDEFEADPTVSLTALFGETPIVLQGLQAVRYSFFELKLAFQTSLISIEQSGQRICLYKAEDNKEFSFYLPLERIPSIFDGVNAIENGMQYVAAAAAKYLENPKLEDNFSSSVKINYETLKIIESICRN